MEALAPFIIGLGVLIALVGSIWFLFTAFTESLLWGLICLFTGVGNLIFLLLHWDRAKRPFGIALLGGIISALGAWVVHPNRPGWF